MIQPPNPIRVARLLRRLTRAARREPSAPPDDPAEPLLVWGRRLLPAHFVKPPSAMHGWLAAEVDRFMHVRGQKVNLVGPRGGAKSTLGSLALVLRAALSGREGYIWIVSDTARQARTHLENVKSELTDNRLLRAAYPQATGRGPVWQAGKVTLRTGAVIEAYGAGQRLRGKRRRQLRPTLIVCDDLQNDGHIVSPRQRAASRDWFHGALLKAGSATTNIVNLATALHREAIAMELLETPGWRSRLFRAIERWPDRTDLWAEWERLYCQTDSSTSAADADVFYLANREAMHAGAEVLWPAEEDLLALMKQRAESGRTAFEREKQSSPVDPTRCEWPEGYFAGALWFDDWPAELRLRTLALDPSKGAGSQQGDYSAYVLLGIDECGVLHVDADLGWGSTSAGCCT